MGRRERRAREIAAWVAVAGLLAERPDIERAAATARRAGEWKSAAWHRRRVLAAIDAARPVVRYALALEPAPHRTTSQNGGGGHHEGFREADRS
jgi:hypothetical protein